MAARLSSIEQQVFTTMLPFQALSVVLSTLTLVGPAQVGMSQTVLETNTAHFHTIE